MLESWQQYHQSPASRVLDPPYISWVCRHITNEDRLTFSEYRISRQAPGLYGCVVSTARFASSSPMHAMHNPDDTESNVVVYSLATHEPVYFQSFPGKQSDLTAIRTVLTQLHTWGIENICLITGKDDDSLAQIGALLREQIPFLIAAEVEQTPVFECLSQVQFNELGLPSNMDYDSETGYYCLQIPLEPLDVPLPDGGSMRAEGVKVNLYLDIQRRVSELNKLQLAIDAQSNEIHKIHSGEREMPSIQAFNKEFTWFWAKHHDGNQTIVETAQILARTDARAKVVTTAGFIASLQWNIDHSAKQSLHDERLRTAQERYFYGLRNAFGSDMQDVWTESVRTGRDFIYLTGLIAYSWIEHVWNTTPSLKHSYASTELLIDSMAPIQYVEYPSGDTSMTRFSSEQIKLCTAFQITPPETCMAERQKARKTGRPKGSRNKPKVL